MNCSCVHSLLVKRSYPFSFSIHFPIFMRHCHQLPNMLIPYASQQLPHFSLCIHFLSSFSQVCAKHFTKTAFNTSLTWPTSSFLPSASLPPSWYSFLIGLLEWHPLLSFLLPHSISVPMLVPSLLMLECPGDQLLRQFLFSPSTLTPWVISSKSRT